MEKSTHHTSRAHVHTLHTRRLRKFKQFMLMLSDIYKTSLCTIITCATVVKLQIIFTRFLALEYQFECPAVNCSLKIAPLFFHGDEIYCKLTTAYQSAPT